MNAANEEAVHAFIEEQICLTDIPAVIEAVMNGHRNAPADDLASILDTDSAARRAAKTEIQKLAKTGDLIAERTV